MSDPAARSLAPDTDVDGGAPIVPPATFVPSDPPTEVETEPEPNAPTVTWDGVTGQTALVTGAGRGIGRAIAVRLADAGAKVVALDKDTDLLSVLAKEIDCRTFVADFAEHDPEDVARRVLDRFGPVPVIVNAVGTSTPHTFLELEADDLDLVLATNLRSPWLMTRTLVTRLVADGKPGSVLFVSSLHARVRRGQPHYSATKAAARMLAAEMAAELAPHGIRVNSVSPGWITDQPGDRSHPQVPAGEGGWPDDVARMALVLLSGWSSYTTGADVTVDGGLGLHSWADD